MEQNSSLEKRADAGNPPNLTILSAEDAARSSVFPLFRFQNQARKKPPHSKLRHGRDLPMSKHRSARYTEMEIKTYRSALDNSMTFAAKFSSLDIVEEQTAMGIVREIVHLVAERYVQENYPQLVAKIDQQAIANLVIAESGKKIAEEIRLTPSRMPDVKINHTHWSLF
jgi:hypothetical protein